MVILLIIVIVVAVIALLAWALGQFVHRMLHDNMARLARWLVGLLALQFVLGMAANLFQKIPNAMPWRVFHEAGPIAVHTLNACVIVILAVWLRVLAARQRRQIAPVAIGGTAVAVAFVCGVVFVDAGQNDAYSFVMSLGFLVALLEFAYVGFRRA